MAILTLALITAAIVAAYSSTSAEVVANSSSRAQDHAYQIAESGLQQFMLRRSDTGFCTNCVANPEVADSEWTRISFPGGYATVVAMRIRPRISKDKPALFFIRSTGVDTVVKMGGTANTVYASRTLGHYTSFGTATIKPIAAWMSLNGITNNMGNASYASYSLRPATGNDGCTSDQVAGISVPKYGSANYRPDALTMTLGWHPQGSPRVDSTRVLDSLKKHIGIDWDAILNYNAIPVDVTILASNPVGWPTTTQFADTSYWPVIRFKGSLSLPTDGRGILIVDNNLTLTSSVTWEGIILVGGTVTVASFSYNSINGILISGLNRTLPDAVNPTPDNYLDNDVVQTIGAKMVVYNSCTVGRATERLKFYFAWPNTWLDNVAIW
jgi:hypothetical protein